MCKSKFVLAILVATLFSIGSTNRAFAAGVDDLQPGYWYMVPNSRLDSVDPCPSGNCSYSGNLGVSSVMDAWSGGAFDTKRNRLMVWGGGHASYAGNELYAFDVQSERWSRLTEPTTNIQMNVARYSDGRPTSRHTYNDIQYDSQRDWFVSMNATAVYNTIGTDYSSVDVYDLTAEQWRPKATRANSGGDGAGSFSAYDPVSGRHFIHLANGGRLQMYDPNADRWTNHVVTGGVPIYMTADIDSTRGQLVAVGQGKIFVYDLNNLNAQPQKNIATGDMTAQNTSQFGFQYDSGSDKFVAWIGGTSVYVLDPETWVWTRQSAAAGNSVTPTPINMNGTYGRFRYIPSKNAFILANGVDDNVYYYKLSAGGGVDPGVPIPPTLSFTASPDAVTAGESSTLSWSSSGTSDCTASGAWSGNVAASGTYSTGPLASSASYSLNCTGAGGNVGRSLSVTVTPGGGGGGADWAARSSAPGVVMATRFDSQSEVMNWRAGSVQENVSWDSGRKASGNGSLRFEILSSDYASAGNWARWLSDDQREFGPGDEFFVQFRQYVPAFLATHSFQGGGGWKQAIISRHAASMNGVNQSQPYGSNQLNEIVLQNTNHRGLVQGYNRDTDGRFPPWEVSARTACSNTDFIYQNAIDRGQQNAGSACENDRARFGGLYSYYQQQPAGYRPGNPDPLSGGFKYFPDEWLTFLVHVRLGQYGGSSNDTEIKIYAAREGGDYTLLIDRNDIDLGDGPTHDTLWLLPYNTGRNPDPNRPDTFTNYDEVIVSTNFIPAPDGNAPPAQVKPMPASNLVAE